MLWFEETVFCDGASGTATTWVLPLEQSLKVGGATVAFITLHFQAVGAGAGTTTLQFERSSILSDDNDAWESLGGNVAFTRTKFWQRKTFGQDTATWAHGLLRFKLTNSGATENWCMIRLRIWVTLQPG